MTKYDKNETNKDKTINRSERNVDVNSEKRSSSGGTIREVRVIKSGNKIVVVKTKNRALTKTVRVASRVHKTPILNYDNSLLKRVRVAYADIYNQEEQDVNKAIRSLAKYIK